MYGTPENNAQLVEQLDREITQISRSMEMKRASHQQEMDQLLERLAAVQARAEAIRPAVIKIIDWANDDRQRIHRALNGVRRATKSKDIALDGRVKYEGDRLSNAAYVSYPMGEGLGEAICAALKAEGLAVDWSGNEGRAIVIEPSFKSVRYHERNDYNSTLPYSERPRVLVAVPEGR